MTDRALLAGATLGKPLVDVEVMAATSALWKYIKLVEDASNGCVTDG